MCDDYKPDSPEFEAVCTLICNMIRDRSMALDVATDPSTPPDVKMRIDQAAGPLRVALVYTSHKDMLDLKMKLLKRTNEGSPLSHQTKPTKESIIRWNQFIDEYEMNKYTIADNKPDIVIGQTLKSLCDYINMGFVRSETSIKTFFLYIVCMGEDYITTDNTSLVDITASEPTKKLLMQGGLNTVLAGTFFNI